MIIFSHPYGAPTTVIRLRNPELGDDESINLFTRFKVAMDGSDYSYRSSPATKSLNLRFTNLTRRKAMELRNFLNVSCGDEIGYSDHSGTQWRGYLLIEAVDLITDGKGPGPATHRKESTSIDLQFEGVKV